MKFKVGDIVKGNESCNGRYRFTIEGWIGRVTDVSCDGRVIDVEDPLDVPSFFGHCNFSVSAECFDLIGKQI